jgi:hypothetical protein
MRIKVTREGGFTAIPLNAEVGGDSLSAEESRRLKGLVEAADFFNLPATVRARGAGADRFQYTVTVEEGDRRHTVRTSDAAAPEALQDLIDDVLKAARKKKSS